MPKLLVQADSGKDLAARLQEARDRTDEIFRIVRPDALLDRPIQERHRFAFYLGHLEAFDVNLIIRRARGGDPVDPALDELFAFGIDPVDGHLPDEPASFWPGRTAIGAYAARARAAVDACLSRPWPSGSPHRETEALGMAIEHRLMHAETLAYMLHRLPHDRKIAPALAAPPAPVRGERREMIGIPAGRATLGRPRDDGGYGWDNEFDEHSVEVAAFSIEADKVTNARFLEFVQDGGYEARDLWTEPDWDWKEHRGIRHPISWDARDGGWFYRGMFADVPLPRQAPAEVSHAEAAAFARWARRSLPSEAEFHRAAYGAADGGERAYPWGIEEPAPRHGNFDLRHWDPTPVGSFPDGDSAFGVSELVGNGWEWTRSAFGPFPGFRPHPLYAGYSADFFDGCHHVLKGGSPRTAACMLRRSFRNWFQPHYPFVCASFRLVER